MFVYQWKIYFCLKIIYYLSSLINVARVEETGEDEEADPEYNYLEDSEHSEIDFDEMKEENRVDRAARITKKEYNDLINELLDSFDVQDSDGEESSNTNKKYSTKMLPPPPVVSN